MSTWSGTLQIKEQIQAYLNDKAFETGGTKVDLLLKWASNIVNYITAELDFRHLLIQEQRTITTADWMWTVPANFQKRSKRFTKVRVGDDYIEEYTLEDLNALDPNHSDTTTETKPTCWALEGRTLHFYPLWAGTIVLENYYRYPTAMSADGDSPDIPGTTSDTLIDDIIIAGVLGRYGFPMLGEFDQATYWQNQYAEMFDTFKRDIRKTDTSLKDVVIQY